MSLSLFAIILPKMVFAEGVGSQVFWQDQHYIYRSLPHYFELEESSLVPSLLTGATEEALIAVRERMERLDESQGEGRLLTRVKDRLEAEEELNDILEDLNGMVRDTTGYVEDRFALTDLAPKALGVFGSFGFSGSLGISLSGSVSLGFVFFIDKVDRIAKADLLTYSDNAALEEAFIQSVFYELDKSFADSLTTFGNSFFRSETLSQEAIPVTTYYDFDAAPIVMFAPGAGAGIGGGASGRIGIMPIWWQGNRLLEPEDIYGWGMALSQDLSGGVGYNIKLGTVNSTNVTSRNGWFSSSMDYFFGAIAFTLGSQTEFSPTKVNYINIKPLSLLSSFLHDEAERAAEKAVEKLQEELFEELENLRANDPGSR
jgi:hypothetical protein